MKVEVKCIDSKSIEATLGGGEAVGIGQVVGTMRASAWGRDLIGL